MPRPVQKAVAAAVLPQNLCRSFTRTRRYEVLVTDYPDASSQRLSEGFIDNSRKSWQLTRRLETSDIVALRDFYDARKGPSEPFFFYDPYDVPLYQPIGSNWDSGGANLQGRYTVRFDGEFRETIGLRRHEAPLQLIELADSGTGTTLDFSQTSNSSLIGLP